jgi:hypothetical protein
MAKKQTAQTAVAPKASLRSSVVNQPTPHALPVAEVLDVLQAQAIDAMPAHVFDDGPTTETTPIMKRMRSEIGSAAINAKRDPSLRASVAIEVRCDRDEGSDAGHYQVRAGGHVSHESRNGPVEADFPVSTNVNDADGRLTLDCDQMREEIANAVRVTNEAHKLP